MPKSKPFSFTPPSPEEIAAARLKRHQDYLTQARHLIDDADWNWHCRSRRCRRNGCQDVRRCEPRERTRVHNVIIGLLHANLKENSFDRKEREGPGAAERRALLARAKARGWMPF